MMALLAGLRNPFTDVLSGLERCIARGGGRALLRVFAGLVLGWWFYVPVHELLHAYGCLLTGGTVDQLDIAPLYGGTVLEQLIPFVTAGGPYAGRLSGFDTHGNDLIYAATVLAPYLLTLFPGVYWLLTAGRRRMPFLFGLSLPMALAPLISLPGDAYELGSIAVSRLPYWSDPAVSEALRGDDIFLLVQQWADAPPSPWLGGGLALLVGAAWAFATYGIGRWLGRSPWNRQAVTL
jgi:hypothetical protein